MHQKNTERKENIKGKRELWPCSRESDIIYEQYNLSKVKMEAFLLMSLKDFIVHYFHNWKRNHDPFYFDFFSAFLDLSVRGS
jgi:hypothetical protein